MEWICVIVRSNQWIGGSVADIGKTIRVGSGILVNYNDDLFDVRTW